MSAIFASLLAGVALPPVSGNTAQPADQCLSGPKGATPDGKHWYYRIDRATKRRCWYLGDEGEKLSRVAPRDSSPSANAVSPQKETAIQPSVADAHAELPPPQTSVEQDTNLVAAQPIPVPAANAASVGYDQTANAPDANTQRSAFSSRWPEPSGVNSSASPKMASAAPATDDRVAGLQPNSETASPQSPEEVSPPVLAAVKFAAADSSLEKPSVSIQMLLIVILGGLSFAGLIGSAIYSSARWSRRRKTRTDRRAIWDSIDADRPSPSAYPDSGRPLPRAAYLDSGRPVPRAAYPESGRPAPRAVPPREAHAADDPGARIVEMLERLSRSAQA
jgi:hypothetical protein